MTYQNRIFIKCRGTYTSFPVFKMTWQSHSFPSWGAFLQDPTQRFHLEFSYYLHQYLWRKFTSRGSWSHQSVDWIMHRDVLQKNKSSRIIWFWWLHSCLKLFIYFLVSLILKAVPIIYVKKKKRQKTPKPTSVPKLKFEWREIHMEQSQITLSLCSVLCPALTLWWG